MKYKDAVHLHDKTEETIQFQTTAFLGELQPKIQLRFRDTGGHCFAQRTYWNTSQAWHLEGTLGT